ncbi:MAG TPA: TonB-dependent receptor, partial [Gemmatimonadaceae bacterium]
IEPFHLKDMGDALSIVDLGSLGGAELMTGGPPAEYGDQLAGVFRLHSLAPRVDRARTSLGISLTNVRAMSQGGFAGGKGGWLVSGRRGYLDLAFKLASLNDSIYPRYNDLFGKVTYSLGRGELAIHTLHAADGLRYQDSRAPLLESRYFSNYAWGTVSQDFGRAGRSDGVLWFGALDWRRTIDGSDSDQEFTGVHVSDLRGLHTMGVKDDWSIDVGDRALLKLGFDLRHEAARYDYDRRLDRRVVINHAVVVQTDSLTTLLRPNDDAAAVYLAQRIRPIEPLTVEGGLRYERATATNDAILAPRFNASWQPMAGTVVRASWGDYSQRESIFALQVQDGIQQLYPAERATQTVLGLEQTMGGEMTGRLELYSRRLSHFRPRYINASAEISVFPEMAYDRVLVTPSDGRSRGVELSLTRPGESVDWTASFARSSATYVVSGVRLPRPSDQPNTFHLDWSAHSASNSSRFTASAVWHTGWPYTPDRFQLDTVGTSPNQSLYVTRSSGNLNSLRLPAYQRVDARWTRFFDRANSRVAFFIDVYNLFNTTNVRDVATGVNFNRLNARYFNYNKELLPRIPSFGINWEF